MISSEIVKFTPENEAICLLKMNKVHFYFSETPYATEQIIRAWMENECFIKIKGRLKSY